MYEENEDCESFYETPNVENLKIRMREEEKKKFRNLAYKAYDMLVKEGMDSVDLKNKENAILAIRRVLGLMEQEEEFERCFFLKTFLNEKLGVANPEPLFDFND